ncbi:MAG: hypothetical protein L3J95_01895 [Thermoplasmata archaeon]|nr:hypothetical protein [Thermoplasmata archaeon]MCI4359164.1 hypothetical protein [Thermoplasmata archaeon]
MSAGRGWFGLPKIDPEEKERALHDPGPPWRVWLASSFAKTYLGLGFLISDGIIFASWLGPPPNWPGLVGSLALALYLEHLLWQYLWYHPRSYGDTPASFADRSGTTGAHAPPSEPAGSAWGARLRRGLHPFPYGRWTETAERRRKGLAPGPTEGPDPREFL